MGQRAGWLRPPNEATGTKTFIAKYRANGGGRTASQRVVTIGRFGTLTADQARKQAKKILEAPRWGAIPQQTFTRSGAK